MAVTSLDVATIEREIALLVEAYPELADDETLRADMVVGSTDIDKMLGFLVKRLLRVRGLREEQRAEMNDLRTRAERYAKQELDIEDSIERLLRAADLRKVELARATVSLRAKPPAVIVNEDELPDEYFRVRKEADRARIKEELKEGRFIPGATLSNSGETISIRVV